MIRSLLSYSWTILLAGILLFCLIKWMLGLIAGDGTCWQLLGAAGLGIVLASFVPEPNQE